MRLLTSTFLFLYISSLQTICSNIPNAFVPFTSKYLPFPQSQLQKSSTLSYFRPEIRSIIFSNLNSLLFKNPIIHVWYNYIHFYTHPSFPVILTAVPWQTASIATCIFDSIDIPCSELPERCIQTSFPLPSILSIMVQCSLRW
jgi:hypothetical protein